MIITNDPSQPKIRVVKTHRVAGEEVYSSRKKSQTEMNQNIMATQSADATIANNQSPMVN